MPGVKGRAVLVRRNSIVLAGVKTKSISIAGSPIDVTSDDSAGFRQLMDNPGQIDVSIKIAGIAVTETLRSQAIAESGRVLTTEFVFPGYEGSPGNTHGFSGPFFIASYTESAEYNGAVTFEAELQSAGTVTYLPK